MELKPQRLFSGSKLRLWKGIWTSTAQPWESMRALAFQIASHSFWNSRLASVKPSMRAPSGVSWNMKPLRRSWKVSKRRVTRSSVSKSESRVSFVAMIFSGSSS